MLLVCGSGAAVVVLSGSASALTGDINNDGAVGQADLTALLADWGTSTAAADLNGNGKVDVYDLSLLLSNWGKTDTKPAIPTGLTATAGDSQVTLNWSANPSSDSVDVYQVYENDQNYNLSVSGTSLVVTGLTNGTTYTFRVSAHNSAGYGDWTATAVSATPQSAGGGGGGGGGGSGSGNGIGLAQINDTFSQMSHQTSYSMGIAQADDTAVCSVSGMRGLLYQSGTDESTQVNLGVPWSTANANGWLLKDSGGSLLVNQGYTASNIGDVGSSGYQQAWINGVSSLLSSTGCDGVFIDDTLYDIEPLAGEYPAKYPSQAAWADAMNSFIAAVGPALKAQGYYVVPNASGYIPGDGNSNDGTNDVAWFQRLGPYVNGLMNEFYAQTSDGSYTLRTNGSAWNQSWDGWQRLVLTAENMGDDFVGVTYGRSTNDTQAMRFGKGSFLLDWNGGGSVFMYNNTDHSDPWNSNWTASIGTPSAAKTNPQSGVWQRTYSGGQVIVNTTASTVTVSGHTVPSTDAYIGP